MTFEHVKEVLGLALPLVGVIVGAGISARTALKLATKADERAAEQRKADRISQARAKRVPELAAVVVELRALAMSVVLSGVEAGRSPWGEMGGGPARAQQLIDDFAMQKRLSQLGLECALDGDTELAERVSRLSNLLVGLTVEVNLWSQKGGEIPVNLIGVTNEMQQI